MPIKLSLKRVAADTLRLYARNWRIVLPVAILAAFIPLAIEVFIAHQLPDGWAAVLSTVVDTLATVFFAGAAEELVHRWVVGERRIPLRGVLARIPPVLLRLALVSVAAALGAVVGLLLFVVPGLILATWWALVGPVVVAERPGFRKTFGRSRQLVRGNAWRVFAIVVGAEVVAALIGVLISAIFQLFGDSPDEPVALAIGEAITLPLEGLAIPVIYWRLREIEDHEKAAQTDEQAPGAETTTAA
jgi:hypothetical protein